MKPENDRQAELALFANIVVDLIDESLLSLKDFFNGEVATKIKRDHRTMFHFFERLGEKERKELEYTLKYFLITTLAGLLFKLESGTVPMGDRAFYDFELKMLNQLTGNESLITAYGTNDELMNSFWQCIEKRMPLVTER